MLSSPHILFRFTVDHQYFDSLPTLKPLALYPPAEMSQSIYLKDKGDERIVYIKGNRASFMNKPLLFPIRFTDPYFLNYTDVDWVKEEEKNNSSSGNTHILVFVSISEDEDESLSSEQAHYLPLFPKRFLIPLPGSDVLHLHKVSIGYLGSKNMEERPLTTVSSGYLLDLQGEGDNAYTLRFTFSDKSIRDFSFVASDALYHHPSPAALLWMPESKEEEGKGKSQNEGHLFDDIFADDQLQIFEGIGPEIEEGLKKMGINSWGKLAESSTMPLVAILERSGSVKNLHNPASWAVQARMAIKGDWDKLIRFQQALHIVREGVGEGDTPAKIQKEFLKREAEKNIPHSTEKQKKDGDVISYEEEKGLGQRIILSFKARATYWKYFFTGLDKSDWENTTISPVKTNEGEVDFEKEKSPVLLPNQQKAFVFSSKTPIRLRNKPSEKVLLKSPYFKLGKRLPCPGPSIIKRMKNTEEAAPLYCSEIFVNL